MPRTRALATWRLKSCAYSITVEGPLAHDPALRLTNMRYGDGLCSQHLGGRSQQTTWIKALTTLLMWAHDLIPDPKTPSPHCGSSKAVEPAKLFAAGRKWVLNLR
eukprot:1887149-Amphidinium_carterae.2